jgi:signal transduction histidine kinase
MPQRLSAHRAPESLSLILRQVPGVVWATDTALTFTYVHGQLIRATAEEQQRLVGTTLYDFFETRDPTEPAIAHHLAALSGTRQSFLHMQRGRLFDVVVEPLRDSSGAIVGCVGAAIDVTDRHETQERLAASEARLAEAQRVAHVGSFEWAVDTDRMTWSDELLRICGLTSGETATSLHAFLGMAYPDDEVRLRAVLFDVWRDPKPFTHEYRIVKPSGEIRMLHMVGDVLPTAAGVRHIVGSCWDITAQHDTMERLRQSVSLLTSTLAATADGILVVSRQGRVSAHNERFLKLWRVPASLVDRNDDAALLAFVGEQLEDPDEFLNRIRELYASPELDAFDVIKFKDGRVFERYALPQRINDEVVGRVWSFRDVTDRERLLARATFLADATRMLASLDIKPALRSVARLAVPYLGERCAIDLMLGDGPERLSGADGADDEEPALELQPATLAGQSTIYTDGTRSHMAVPLMCRNALIGAITFRAPQGRQYSTDDLDLLDELGRRVTLGIDNAQLYQRAREALDARDEFLSVAAHEIRGPVTSLHLAVQSLSRGSLSSSMARTALEVIQREDRRLARFVEELLDVGRIRTGRLHLEIEPVDAGTILRDVVSRLSTDLSEAGSTVTVKTEGHLVGEWDRFRLDQVLTNLLDNAIKYGRGRPIDATASETGGRVFISVTDQGIGIDPAVLGTIFDPFQRAAGEHYGGLGLGLHISKTIVEGLGGAIRVESTPDQGSRFTVELPVSQGRR